MESIDNENKDKNPEVPKSPEPPKIRTLVDAVGVIAVGAIIGWKLLEKFVKDKDKKKDNGKKSIPKTIATESTPNLMIEDPDESKAIQSKIQGLKPKWEVKNVDDDNKGGGMLVSE
ncbi:hypothetical protein GCM10011514_35670 [Emticicia aquatilis]|uniref:Uncharacterized protein n=1 Tax=Emticicia aquatilis TaxID=1537369 RepID=A0A916YZE5_9BACT|nr:hypothetical protein [Emticicia aquatilis]GGD68432.1 hypothetical protein GCM10011514_35670 [Emticicia aquatilis]